MICCFVDCDECTLLCVLSNNLTKWVKLESTNKECYFKKPHFLETKNVCFGQSSN